MQKHSLKKLGQPQAEMENSQLAPVPLVLFFFSQYPSQALTKLETSPHNKFKTSLKRHLTEEETWEHLCKLDLLKKQNTK